MKKINIRLKNRLKISELMIIIFVTIFTVTDSTRKYILGSGPGTIDNYVNIGYGQKFPEATFQNHYYKESRLLTIIWVSITNNLKLNTYIIFSLSLSVITSLIFINLLWKKFPNYKAQCLGFAMILALSPFFWGEYVGGSDNYNQIGNFIGILYIRYCFIHLDLISSDKNKKSNKYLKNRKKSLRKPLVIIGIGTFIIINEVPTGVFAALIPLFVFARKNIKNLIRKETNFKTIFHEIFLICSGILGALFFYTLLFLVTSQSPERSLSGIKFIFTSVANPQIQLDYFLPLSETLVWGSSVASTLILALLLFLNALLNKSKKISFSNTLGDFEYSFLIIVFYLLGAQLLEKNIVFGSTLPLGYFLAPILLCGYVLVTLRILEVLKYVHLNCTTRFFNSNFLVLLVLVGMGFVLNLTWHQIAFCILFSLTSFLIQEFIKKSDDSVTPKIFTGQFIRVIRSKNFISQSLIWVTIVFSMIFLPSTSLNSQTNDECESFYYFKKQDALRVAENIDNAAGKRGTVYMGADSSVINLDIDFRACGTSKYIRLADYLYAISAMGFIPVDQVDVSKINEVKGNDWNYQQTRLAVITENTETPDVCMVIWSLYPSKVVTYLDVDEKRIFSNLTC